MRLRLIGMRLVGNALRTCISPVVASLSLASAAIVVSTQDAPQAPIRVPTRLVQVNVIARAGKGPIADLTKDDFIVLDREKPQKISIFSVESSESPLEPAQHLPPNTFSDLPKYGAAKPRSVTIVLLDNLNTLYGSAPDSQYERTPFWIEDLALQRAKVHLVEFIKTMDPQDRLAIYGLRDSLYVLCDFTNDRAQLLAILGKYDTSSSTNRAVVEPGYKTAPVLEHKADPFENFAALSVAGMANETREAETMTALESIADHVANIPGRKNLVWLTANLSFSGAAMARVLGPANIAVYPVDSRGLLARSTSVQTLYGTADYDDVSGASGDRDNMPGQSSQPIGLPAMEKVAEETGGQAFVNTNDITGAIRKAVQDSEVTYTLGFYIDRDSIDGKFHQLKVEVKRKGVTVRYPRSYFAFEDAPPAKDENRNKLITAVRSPIESSAIPVQVRIDRVDKPLPHCLSIFGSIDIRNLRLTQNGGIRKGDLEVITIEQDATGKVLAQSGSAIHLRFADEQYSDYTKSGFPFHQYVQPRANASTLRILVEDPATAEVGSLIIPLSRLK
jgi:VWFA-related protein